MQSYSAEYFYVRYTVETRGFFQFEIILNVLVTIPVATLISYVVNHVVVRSVHCFLWFHSEIGV